MTDVQPSPAAPAAPRVLFREVQPLHQNAIIRWLIPADAVLAGVIFFGIGSQQPSIAPTLLLVWLGIVALTLLLMFALRMRTLVVAGASGGWLDVRLFPFGRAVVDLGLVAAAEPATHDPIGDAMGWGWRKSRKLGRVATVSGERGVRVVTAEEPPRLFFIGSRRPDELAEAILAGSLATTPSAE